MADDRTVIELIVMGAQQSVRQILSVSQAQTQLVVVQESLGVRQKVVYDQIAKAAEQSAIAQERAAKAAEAAVRRSTTAAESAAGRARDPSGRFISREAEQQRQIAAQTAGLSSNLTPQRLQVQIDAASFTAARNALVAQRDAAAAAAVQAQTFQGRLQALGQAAQQAAQQFLGLNKGTTNSVGHAQNQATQQQVVALRQLATSAQGAAAQQEVLTKAGRNAAAQLLSTAAAATKQANSLAGLTNASSRAGSSGLSYLSVLSAIHAASFLSTNRTFSLIGSFVTLGLAFNKMGVAAGAAGLALGAILAVFGQISAAIQTIQQATIKGAVALAGFGAAAGAALIAAGASGVKMAADVETQLASVKAFGNATNAELREVRDKADELGARFGIAAADVVEATSLFARAGGTVREAMDGATEAIVKLTVASQGELTAAQAAIALSAAMKEFSLAGEQAGRVADNLVATAQASALSFAGVQQAFVQAAPGAAALGITIEDLSASIALLGDQLIKGNTTGTAFKQFMLDLLNPTDKAQEALAKYGISLKDADGNALPFLDALAALNKGLGDNVIGNSEAAKAARGTALTIVFGSRAFLAANILTRGGTEELEKYRTKLSEVSASKVVETLMLPLNKQLERVPILAQQAGAAFGGSLLGPARGAITEIIAVLQGIKPAAEAAGQAVAVILTGQGFGELQKTLEGLTSNRDVSAFFLELVNVFRNVADVIKGTIVPAIISFGQTLLDTFTQLSGQKTIAGTFEQINLSIRKIGVAAAIVIGNLAQLTKEFILGISTGGQLRETLLRIANAVATNLVAAFQVFVLTIGAAIGLMPILSQGALLAARFLVSLASVVNGLRLAFSIATDQVKKFVLVNLAIGELARGNIVGAIENLGKLAEAQGKTAEAEALRASIIAENNAMSALLGTAEQAVGALDGLSASFKAVTDRSAEATANLAITRKTVDQLADEMIVAWAAAAQVDPTEIPEGIRNSLISQAGAIKEAARLATSGIITIFDDLQGEIPNPFANLDAQIEAAERSLQRSFSGTQPGPVGGLSQEELDRIKNRISEAGRDISKRLQNLAEDAATRTTELIARALERLDDIKQNALQRIDDITKATNDRIEESRRSTRERREDRKDTDDFRQNQEDKFQVFQRDMDRQADARQRDLEDTQRTRQQSNEDFARGTEQQFQDEESLQQRRIQVVQRAYDMIQQARETAFDRAQALEATAFSRTQQAAAEARQFSLALANAKTPEDRAQLTKQRTQALQDTKFQQGQEDAMTVFSQKQEAKKQEFQRGLELEQIGFRQGLEERFNAFRRTQEQSLLKFRRAEESKELGLRRGEEDALLATRLRNEDTVAEKRRADALAFQTFQDGIENKRAAEEETRTRATALEEIRKEGEKANKLAQEVEDTFLLDLIKQTNDVQSQIRNIIDALLDMQDSVPPELLGNFLATLGEARSKADGVASSLAGVQEQAQLTFDQRRATNEAEVLLAQQRAQQALATSAGAAQAPVGQRVPGQVLSLQTLQVAQVILPASFGTAVAFGVQLGIQQAIERGLLPGQFDIDIVPITDRLDSIRRGIG